MSTTVSGGKALHLPGISSVPQDDENPNTVRNPNLKEWAGISLVFLFMSSLPFTVYQVFALPVIRKEEAAHKAVNPNALGFFLEHNDALDVRYNLMVLLFAGFIVIISFWIYLSNIKFVKKVENIIASLVFLSLSALGVQGYFLSQSPINEYAQHSAFDEWAKKKFDLKEIEFYNPDKPKDELKAQKNDGSDITLHMYRAGKNAYLYQTPDELPSILSEIPKQSK